MKKPNFVLIMTDTQGVNVLGTYGHPEVMTPNIDNLSKNGIKFTRAYTTCPLCTPSRAGIFTGMYPHSCGAWANGLPLSANVKTMGQRFQDFGYQTTYIGKWHLDGHDYFGNGICPEGWDERYWYDAKCHLDELNPKEAILWRQGLSTIEALHANNINPEFTMAHRVSNRAVEFLRTHSERPFVLVVSYDEPHDPHTCPPEYVERFEEYAHPIGPAAFDTLENKPAHHREWAEAVKGHSKYGVRHENGFMVHPMYFGCNSFVDHEIGRVLEAIERYAPKNTYTIFTSDHGAMFWAHQLWSKGPAMYEEITHIPLIVRPPEKHDGEIVNSTLVSHIDLLPTMLELAGVDVPPILEGESLVPIIHGAGLQDRTVFIEYNGFEVWLDYLGCFQPIRCVINGRYKLVLNLLHGDELYDLESDPAELQNLIENSHYGSVRDSLHDHVLDWMYERGDSFRGPCWEKRPWRKSQRYAWEVKWRHRPADGYSPEVRDYSTGLPIRLE